MIISEKRPIEIIPLNYFETNSTVMEFHEYQSKWDPIIDEILEARIEQMKQTNMQWSSSNLFQVFGRLPKKKTRKFAKMIFYFLKFSFCKVKATGKIFNLGYSKETIIPCLLQFSKPKNNIELLHKLRKDCKKYGSFFEILCFYH